MRQVLVLKLVQAWCYLRWFPRLILKQVWYCCPSWYQSGRVLATSVDTGVDARCRPIYQTNIGVSLLYLSAFYQPTKFHQKVDWKLKMKWLLKVSIAKNGNKFFFKNHLISVVGFQHVNIIIEAWLKYCSLYLVYSQIWLHLPQDDHHLRYILKNSKNNISTYWEWYSLTTLISSQQKAIQKFSMCYFTILLCWQILTAFVVAILCALWVCVLLALNRLQKTL
jgi:hypothetical protein